MAPSPARPLPIWSGQTDRLVSTCGQKPFAKSVGHKRWPFVPLGQSEGLTFEGTGPNNMVLKAVDSATRPAIRDWPANTFAITYKVSTAGASASASLKNTWTARHSSLQSATFCSNANDRPMLWPAGSRRMTQNHVARTGRLEWVQGCPSHIWQTGLQCIHWTMQVQDLQCGEASKTGLVMLRWKIVRRLGWGQSKLKARQCQKNAQKNKNNI